MPPRQDLIARSRAFSVALLHYATDLPRTEAHRIIGRQMMRSGTSVSANLCAAYRARSQAEFIAKLCIVEEESDETMHWLEVLRDYSGAPEAGWYGLHREADALTAVVVAMKKTARLSARSLAK